MGTKTAAEVRPEIPLQKDGLAELQELAAALSEQVEQRHRQRGSHAVEAVPEPERFDLTAEPEPLPVREPKPLPAVVTRRAGRAVPLVLAGVLTAVVSAAGWSATRSPQSAPASRTTASQPPAATSTPTTPTEWGAAAHQRLTGAGHPVDVFACQSAYAADAAVAGGALPPAATAPDIWRAYLAACLSDMSGASISRSG